MEGGGGQSTNNQSLEQQQGSGCAKGGDGVTNLKYSICSYINTKMFCRQNFTVSDYSSSVTHRGVIGSSLVFTG